MCSLTTLYAFGNQCSVDSFFCAYTEVAHRLDVVCSYALYFISLIPRSSHCSKKFNSIMNVSALCIFYFWFAIAHSFIPQPRVNRTSSIALHLPSLSNAADAIFSNSSLAITNKVRESLTHCDGAAYGRSLNRQSCYDAWISMPDDETLRGFGPRGAGSYEYQLPRRYLGSEFLKFYEPKSWSS